MKVADGLVDAVLASPLGVSWLAVLEAGFPDDERWRSISPVADPSSIAASVDRIAEMSFGSLMRAAVFSGATQSGPWTPDAPATIASAYRQAERRAPIAEAIAARFSKQLHAPLVLDRQQWFSDGSPGIGTIAPLFRNFDDVYGAGEFTWAGLWTTTDPPPDAILEMVGAWEYETGPITRLWMPVRPAVRIFEIHRPQDWARLVTSHPRPAVSHPGWELPGVNQHHAEVSPLLALPEQRATRVSVRHHLVPDWQMVAGQYDGIHLSWAGFITSEGCIVDLGGGDATMLRYWFSERTAWLADVFGQPSSAPDPHIDLATRNHWPPLPPGATIDSDLIVRLLGRPPNAPCT